MTLPDSGAIDFENQLLGELIPRYQVEAPPIVEGPVYRHFEILSFPRFVQSSQESPIIRIPSARGEGIGALPEMKTIGHIKTRILGISRLEPPSWDE